jgi:hypothetical protein
MNSATSAATSGVRLRPNFSERRFVTEAACTTGRDSTAFTVVTFVVVCFAAVDFLFVDFLAVEAAFLVAMYFPPL